MEAASELLVVSADRTLVADLSEALDESFGARVAVTEAISAAREQLAGSDFDLVITDAPVDEELLELIGASTLQGVPTIVIDDRPEVDCVLSALRAGVIDVLARPIDFVYLQRVVGATLEARRSSNCERARQRRLKELSSRMLRDRRMLRQRIDLLCKDLVAAYRRLAEKVSEHEASV